MSLRVWAVSALAVALLTQGWAAAIELRESEAGFSSASMVSNISVSTQQFSSDGDGYRDSATLSVTLQEPSQIKLDIVSAMGERVTELHGYIRRPAGPYQYKLTGQIRDARGELQAPARGRVQRAGDGEGQDGVEIPIQAQFQVNNTLVDVLVTSDKPDTLRL